MAQGDRRAYFRVPARIAVRHRYVAQDELDAFERELALRGSEPPLPVDPGLRALLDRIERKLDRILVRLEPDRVAPLGEADVRAVEISGSGVRYDCTDPAAVGDHVLVEMLLPGTPPRAVAAIGEIVFRQEAESGAPGCIAVRFTAIDEADREAIIRYTYEVQRVALRARAVGGAAR